MGKILVKQANSGGIMYTRDIGGKKNRGGFMEDLAALRGGARGLNSQGGQSFIPGSELGAAKPTAMQRLGAAGNIAGRGLSAALTAFQTANSLQGGNVGALGTIGDTYAQNVQGLTGGSGTEAQQTQDIATEHYNKVQDETMNQNITGMPSKFLQDMQNAQQPQQYAVGPQNRTGQVGSAATTGKTGPPPPPTSTGTAPPGSQSTSLGQLPPVQPVQPAQPVQPTQPAQPAQPAQQPGLMSPNQMAGILPGMGQPNAAPAAPAQAAPAPAQAAPAPAPAAPYKQPVSSGAGMPSFTPPPAAPVPAPQPAAPAPAQVGVKPSFLDRANEMQFDRQVNKLNLPPAQEQNDIVELAPEQSAQPAQAPAPTTRENRAAMDKKIRSLGQDPEIAANVARMKNNRVPVKQPMQTPPQPQPQPQPQPITDTTPPPKDIWEGIDHSLYNANQSLRGGAVKPTQIQAPIETNIDRTEVPYEKPLQSIQQHGLSANQPQMSGAEMYEGTGVQQDRFPDANWQQESPKYPGVKNPMDAAMAQLQTGRLPVGEREELAPGASIGNTSRFARRKPKSISGSSDEDWKQQQMNPITNDYGRDARGKRDPWAGIPWNTTKAFVDMVFNEFGDLFHKANPHEVGSIVMGLYLDRMVK